MILSADIKKQQRHFLPQDFTVTTWEALEPYFKNLLEREINSEKDLENFWNKYLKDELGKRKNERGHDERLYGGRGFPKLLGYAVGYNIIKNYYKDHIYSTKLSFTIPSVNFINP